MNQVLLFIAASLTLIWGIAHLFPTKSVVKGFGDISTDNQLIITMEWTVEGVTLIFIGILTGLIAWLDSSEYISIVVLTSISIFLFILALISLFTGFRIRFLPFKLCPIIFTISGLMILFGVLT